MAESQPRSITQTVKDYGKKLLGFIRNRVRTDEDAEDILQDVWVQLSSVVNLDEIEQMSGWLYQVARNKITDRYRKKSPSLFADYTLEEDKDDSLPYQDILFDEDTSPEMLFVRERFWEALTEGLAELPENQRQVFVWNELEDLTLQQIADQTGENLKTIISRKGYAVKHLRKRLSSFYQEFFENP